MQHGQSTGIMRARRVSSATTTTTSGSVGNNNNNLIYSSGSSSNDAAVQTQARAQPLEQAPLRRLVNNPEHLHPDDDADHVLAVIFAILDRGGNRAMSVKELGEAAYSQGRMRTSPSAATQAIGTHIRAHMNRHTPESENALLKSYRLEGGSEDVRVAPALFCASPASCRRGTTVWYLSPKAGRSDPFEALAKLEKENVENKDNPLPAAAATATALVSNSSSGVPASHGLKRKIPPDEEPEFQRPNKIRITLRLPARTPIPRRSRPIVPATGLEIDSTDESSGDESQSPSETDEDDQDMLDDFNSLLADDVPIAIPCARSADSFCPSQPFFDTCEPPPDSEDEDDDFHNSMLRPPDLDANDALFLLKQEDFLDFEIKEEDLAAMVLHELGSPEPSTSIHHPFNVKLEDGIQSLTAHPELEWSALHTEDGMFSPMELLGADSPASVDVDEVNSAGVSSPAAYPDVSTALTVPPPTPWIKTEEDTILFNHADSTDLHIVDDDFAPVQSPVSAIPIPSALARPWETTDWVQIPGPESVSTDDVEQACANEFVSKPIAASTSAPSLQSQRRTRRPRLSIGGLTAFNHHGASASARAGHLRRHSHAAGVAPNRRLSIISTAFSDWTSGTPEDTEAPLVTPSHTGWRMQWPMANGSSSTLAHEKIDESVIEDEGSVLEEERKSTVVEESLESDGKDLLRLLGSPLFHQCLAKGMPPNHRIVTTIVLGIPMFQCTVENPPLNLYRRMDTDYVNISSLLTFAKHLAQATPNRSRNPGMPSSSARMQAAPTIDELPPNHIFINSGARDINGGWVPLATAKSVAKNYHDLPTFVRRIFLSDTLAEKFPTPIPTVKQLLNVTRERERGTVPPFGKAFAKPSSLSAHDLLVPGGSAAVTPMPTPVQPTSRGAALITGTSLSNAYPLSPVAVLSNANAMAAKTSMPPVSSLLSLLSQSKGWAAGLVKTPVEPEPLMPEEEEMFKALVKSPPRPKAGGKPGVDEDSDDEKVDMSVDEEEEEVVRGVVDLVSSDEEQDDEEEEEEEKPKRILRSLGKKTEEVLPARRSMRRARSLSTSSSDLTVSESESSAPPPSLDSRPALKGKSTNLPKGMAASLPKVLTPVQPRARRSDAAVVRIIKVDEPNLGKPRRSGRQSKGEKETPTTPVVAPIATKGKGSSSTVPAAAAKPKRGEKEVEKELPAPVVTRAGAAKNQKRTLRSRA